ncbi:MAG: histidine--tRNA ligase [Endomicrobium sp.]|jgi:histidyl-tRNA synthetase|nr:histidine--tRNA ligase [Endomicrobium sp.]
MHYKAQRGTHDIFCEFAEKMNLIDQKFRDIFKKHGFEEIKTPIFEDARLFTHSIGYATDIIEKEMYIFNDKKGRKLALRPEGTSSLVRAFIEHKMDISGSIYKFFYSGEMFRYERPQSGRYRQFHQIGAELFGVSSPAADAEIILLVYDLLNSIGINEIVVHINSLGCKKCRPILNRKLIKYLTSISNLCENCTKRLDINPFRVLDCKEDFNKFVGIPKISDYLCYECKHDFDILQSLLSIDCKYNFVVDDKLVRGLNYYTKTVFEICYKNICSLKNKDFILAAGGRYDNLVEELGGKNTPAVGFALGSERVLIAVKENKNLLFFDNFRKFEKIYIAITDQELFKEAFSFATGITKNKLNNNEYINKNISVFGPISNKNLTEQLKIANKIHVNKTIIFAKKEFKNGKILMRDMKNKTQIEIGISKLINKLI